MAAEAHGRAGPVTILVNNAGRAGYLDRPIWEQDREGWRASMDVNLDAPFELTRLLVGDMLAARWGRIVMISSTAGQVGAPAMSPYCASKHGVIGLMRSVAQDVAAHGITCNAILPGWVRTEMADRDAQQEGERRGPQRRAGVGRARGREPGRAGGRTRGDRQRGRLPGLRRGLRGQRGGDHGLARQPLVSQPRDSTTIPTSTPPTPTS